MTKEIFNNEGSSIRRAENEVETWWKNLSDSAKKKAKKFWDEINKEWLDEKSIPKPKKKTKKSSTLTGALAKGVGTSK